MMRGFWLFTLLVASVAWLIPWPRLLVVSAALWLVVWFFTLPKPSNRASERTRERGF